MATFEDVGLANQLVSIVFDTSNWYHFKAGVYKQSVLDGRSVESIAAHMNDDFSIQVVRLNRVITLGQNNVPVLTSALAVYGITVQTANQTVNALLDTANSVVAAQKNSLAKIDTIADGIISATPIYEKIRDLA